MSRSARGRTTYPIPQRAQRTANGGLRARTSPGCCRLVPCDELSTFFLPILRSDFDRFARVQTFQQERFELLFSTALLVVTDQVTDVLAGRAETALLNLGLNEFL